MIEDKDPVDKQDPLSRDSSLSVAGPDADAPRGIKIGSQRDADRALGMEQPSETTVSEDAASEAPSVVPQVVNDAVDASAGSDLAEPPRSFPPPRLARISKELQDEIDAALGDFSVDELLAHDAGKIKDASQDIELDSRYRGTVVKIHRDSVFFSLGGNHEGIASLKQFAQPPQPGTVLEVVPTKFLPEEFLYELVVPGASIDVADWSDLSEGVIVEALVTGCNKGGLECEVKHIRGFMPAGQVSIFRVEDFEQYVGQKLLCVVAEANPARRNLVLSHRAVLEREKQANREKLLSELAVGQVREGTVTRIQDFGAFVDLGGVDGLIHVSQLSWDRIQHPNEVVEVGQRIKARVEKIDPTTGKIGLSYRDVLTNPWDAAEINYPIGAVVKGTVSKLMEFGAFVKLEPGIEGLVHISELAHHRVHRVSSVVSAGDVVDVKVLSIDKNAQKISLSIKAAQAVAAKEAEDAAEQDAETTDDAASRAPTVRQPEGALKGGLNRSTGGEKFGLKW